MRPTFDPVNSFLCLITLILFFVVLLKCQAEEERGGRERGKGEGASGDPRGQLVILRFD